MYAYIKHFNQLKCFQYGTGNIYSSLSKAKQVPDARCQFRNTTGEIQKKNKIANLLQFSIYIPQLTKFSYHIQQFIYSLGYVELGCSVGGGGCSESNKLPKSIGLM